MACRLLNRQPSHLKKRSVTRIVVLVKATRTTLPFIICWVKGMLLPTEMSSIPMHYSDVIMGTIASQITSLTIVYSIVYSDADQRKHQSSASLAFVRGIHRGTGNSPHKWPVTRKMFPFDDVILCKSWIITGLYIMAMSAWILINIVNSHSYNIHDM